MKKSRQIFGAVALSAVLAMGTAMPAFAAVDGNLSGDDLKSDANNNAYVNTDGSLNGDYWKNYSKDNLADGASTAVNISTYSSNYSVTVPLFAPFMLDTAGGDGIAPTNYGIINGGEAAVFVTDVKWEMTQSGDWTFGDGSATDNDGLGSDANPMSVVQKKAGSYTTSNKGTYLPTYGSFVITLAPENTDYNPDDKTVSYGEPVNTFVPAPTGSAANAATAHKAVKWIINPKDPDNKVKDQDFNGITLSIKGSVLYKSLENIQTDVAAITYTVDSRAPEGTPAP